MERIQNKMRHELKFHINSQEYYILKSRISHILKNDGHADENNEYNIRSLYFDSIYNKDLFEKLSGVEKREKFRMRIYNMSDRVIKLERKAKIGELTDKQTVRIGRDDAGRILAGDIGYLVDSRERLLRKFYIESRNNLLKPVVIVDYVREAYVHPAGNLRITFDKKLRTGLSSVDIFNESIPMVNAFDESLMIMEVKYDEFIPAFARSLIQTISRQKSSISKYSMCRKFNKSNNWEDN